MHIYFRCHYLEKRIALSLLERRMNFVCHTYIKNIEKIILPYTTYDEKIATVFKHNLQLHFIPHNTFKIVYFVLAYSLYVLF